MKAFILWILFLFFIYSCSNEQEQRERDAKIQTAITEKDKAERNLSDFKVRAAVDFKGYDSLKAKGIITTAIQIKHDSLFAEGIRLAMMIVHKQMEIDSLKKLN
jgi:hypothetical protein